MSKRKCIIAPAFERIGEEIEKIPEQIEKSEGRLLWDGRNKIIAFDHIAGCDKTLVVKKFKKLDFFKRIIYTFFRSNKAKKSYLNALRLTERGIDTPTPIAYIEDYRCGLLQKVYYVCGYTDLHPIRERLVDLVPFDRQMEKDYAQFVASLHEKGVIHKDLNNTNVLFAPLTGGHYHFQLIDINRVKFYSDGDKPNDRVWMENLTLFADRGEMYTAFVNDYVSCRHLPKSYVGEIMKAKVRHDHHWHRKTMIKKLFKKGH